MSEYLRLTRWARAHMGVMAMTVAALALSGCDARAPEPAATPTATPVATPVPSESPNASPSAAPVPSSEPATAWTPPSDASPEVVDLIPGRKPGVFDDGIASTDLPKFAPRRAPDYPAARRMADWVWDYVDDQWALVLFHDSVAEPAAAGYFYLVSPEGVYFEVMRLPERYSRSVELRRWRERDASAVIVFDQDPGWYNTDWAGVVFDLRRGTTDTVRINIGGQGVEGGGPAGGRGRRH